MSAPIQIVDEYDQPAGTASKDEAQAKGLWHRIVRIMVEDNEGRVLLQKRGPNVKLSPNHWDHSAAGHVDAGETYEQAARRELAEETGITGAKLQEIDSYQTTKLEKGRQLNRFNKLYKVMVDAATPFKPQASEVAELRWFSPEKLRQLRVRRSEPLTDGLKRALKFYI